MAETLNARGIAFRGARRWTKDRVLRVVSDRAATGTYLWARGEEEPVEIRVPAVLESETFERAVALRDEREPSKTPGRLTSSPLLLTRVAHCGCGAKLVLETSGKLVAGERPHRYYNCRTTTRVGKSQCAGVRVPEADLDQAVLEHIAERVFSQTRCRELLVELLESGEALRERTADQRKNLRRDLDEVERKIAVWEGHVESGEVPIAVATERLASLRTLREELRTTLAKVVPLRVPPSSVLADETIESFRSMMRESLLEGGPIARTYTRFLVERIDVQRTDDDRRQVRIAARKGNAMRLMHAATQTETQTPPGLEALGGVLTNVASQLRVPSNARTFLVRRNPPAPKVKRAPRARNRGAPGASMAKRAETFRAALAAEPEMTRADLARRLGVSRAWVTRVLGPGPA